MADIRELYQQKQYDSITSSVSEKDISSFSDENDIYRIGRAFQHKGDFVNSSKWFERLTQVNPVEDSYRRYLEVNLKSEEFDKLKMILREMEDKGFLSEYYYGAKYELLKIDGASNSELIDTLSEMVKEYKIAYYMIELAILYVKSDQSKEAGKVLRKVARLFDGDKNADYAIGLSEAISEENEKEYIKDNVYVGESLFGNVSHQSNKEGDLSQINTSAIVENIEPEKENTDKVSSSKKLLQSLGIKPKQKSKRELDNRIVPEYISKSMEDIIGFSEVVDMLLSFDAYLQLKENREQKGYTSFEYNNFAIKGHRGCGTSAAVKVVAKALKNKGIIATSGVVSVSYNYVSGKTYEAVLKIFKEYAGRVIHIDHIDEFYAGGSTGMTAIDRIEKAIVETKGNGSCVIITGAGEDYDKLLQNKKKFSELFKQRTELKPFTAQQLRDLLERFAYESDYGIIENKDGRLVKIIEEKMKEKDFEYLNTLPTMIIDASHKLATRIANKSNKRDEDYVLLLDRDFEADGNEMDEDIEELLNELDGMTGLTEVKKEVHKIISQVQIKAVEKEYGIDGSSGLGNLNLLFVGNPGTGKTTVARIIAKIYKSLGVLSKGHLVEVKRADIVSRYSNASASLTNEKINEALGGVLFIDEAYDIWRGSRDDHGQECINTLVDAMEKNRDNLMIIMAGYEAEMDYMIQNANDGLASRMKTKVHFEDYSKEEMVTIFKQFIKKSGKQLETGIDKEILDLISEKSKVKNFGNARGVRNLVEDVISAQAVRIQQKNLSGEKLEHDDFTIIKAEDMKVPEDGFAPKVKTIDDLLAELNGLIGLGSVKEEVNQLITIEKNNQERKKLGMKALSAGALHMVFQGSAGTGKTTVARIIGEIYKGLGLLSRGHTVETDYSGLVGNYVGHTADKTNKVIQKALGGVLFVDEAYTLADTERGSFGQEAIDTILKAMEDNRDDFMVIVAGYPEPMEKFIDSNEGLNSRFKTKITFEDYSVEEMLEIFKSNLKKNDLVLNKEIEDLVKRYFEKKISEKNFGNARGVRNTVEELIKKQSMRLSKISEKTVEDLQTITEEDFKALPSFDIETEDENENENEGEEVKTIEELLEELNGLIGLSSVKEEINQLVTIEKNNQERKKLGMKALSAGALHMVFQGSAGTGKTTVARIIGEIYKGLGLLSKGHTVETDYSGLVGNYVGHTANKTNEVIQRALGGVLFIDEAYTLADTERGSFGQEAIDTILKAMEDNRDDFMVIVAGYEEPMAEFIDSNEGLNSRFKTKITFEDYSVEEMLEIFKSILKRNELVIDEETESVAKRYFEKKISEKNFGNARGVRNTVEELIKKQSMRVSKIAVKTVEDLQTITVEDFYQLDSTLKNNEDAEEE